LESRQFLSGGGLDRNFGDGGVIEFASSEVNPEVIAFERNGKLLTASGAAVMRLTAKGEVDDSFGDGGKLNVGFRPAGIVVGKDGKIVVGGSVQNKWTVARFNPDSTLDASFGKGGKRTITVGAAETTVSASSLAVFPDGDVVLAGTYLPDDPEWDIDYTYTAVARFNGDGSVDQDFGDNGIVIDGSATWSNDAETVLAKHDGNVILIGHTWSGGHTNFAWFAEYDARGGPVRSGGYAPALDENYGDYTGGVVRPDGAVAIAFNEYPDTVKIYIDGKPAGDLDFSPGVSSGEYAGPVTSDSANRVIVAGYSSVGAQDTLGVHRFTKDGLPDKSFGTNGSASSKLGYDTQFIRAVATAPDGDILVSADAERGEVIFVRFDAHGGTRRRPPTARLRSPVYSPVRPNRGARKMVISVLYSAEKRIVFSSLDDLDVVVRGPNGFKANASFKDFTNTAGGRLVEYVFQAPGKRWDAADNGTYRIAIRRDQVRDNFGNFVDPATIGKFKIQI
jgi:uncharacterized delta-60 repeat protein